MFVGDVGLHGQHQGPGLEHNLRLRRYAVCRRFGRRLGFGARHVGLHYSNKAVIGEGGPGTLAYGAAIVDAVQGYNSTGVNDYGYYGNVSFDTSCSPTVADQFNIGLSLLYSFEYSDALAIFQSIAADEPSCCVAYSMDT